LTGIKASIHLFPWREQWQNAPPIPWKIAAFWIRRIHENGFDVGVHGIDYTTLEGIKKEFDTSGRYFTLSQIGIRMHYLRRNEATLGFMEAAGYRYDSSVRLPEGPSKPGISGNFRCISWTGI